MDKTADRIVNTPAGFPLEDLECFSVKSREVKATVMPQGSWGPWDWPVQNSPGHACPFSQRAVIISILDDVLSRVKDLDLKLVLWGSMHPVFLAPLSCLPDNWEQEKPFYVSGLGVCVFFFKWFCLMLNITQQSRFSSPHFTTGELEVQRI